MTLIDPALAERLKDPKFVQHFQEHLAENAPQADIDAVGQWLKASAEAQRHLADPIGWGHDKLSEFYWSKQREILESVRDNRRTAVRSSHGIGKTKVAATAACWWLDSHPPGEAFVATSAPIASQVRGILWRYIGQAHRKGNLVGRVNQTEWLIGNELIGFGRSPAKPAEGGEDETVTSFQGIHCLDTEHEILTRRGWLGIDEITESDEVLSVPVDGESAEWMPISTVHRYDFAGKLKVYEGAGTNFAVTDGHRVPMRGSAKDQRGWRLTPIKDTPKFWEMRRNSGWKGAADRYVPDPFREFGWSAEQFARFLGFWTGDGGTRTHRNGTTYEVLLYQTKRSEFVTALLDGLPYTKAQDYYAISNKACAQWLHENVGRLQTERVIPRFIVDGDPEVLDAYVDGLWEAEGTLHKGKRKNVYSTSKALMDNLQEILIKLGRPASLGVNRAVGEVVKGPRGPVTTQNTCYVTSWTSDERKAKQFNSANIRDVDYKGRVWCISTPHETFYTRRRGRVMLTGNSRYVLVILDEAGGIPAPLWAAAKSLITGRNNRILVIGNPDDPTSEFERVCREGSGWTVIGVSTFDTPYFTGEVIPQELAELLPDRIWLDEFILDYGEESAVYVAKVLGQFPKDAIDAVVPYSWATSCTKLGLDSDPTSIVSIGADIGAGTDQTVISPMQGRRFLEQRCSRHEDPMDAAGKIVTAIRDYRPTVQRPVDGITVRVNIDAIGVGWGVAGRVAEVCREKGWTDVQVNAVKVSEVATQPEKYKNLRSQLWWAAREFCHDKLYDLGELDEKCINELTTPKWSENSSGQIDVEKRERIVKRLGHSPDRASAAILAPFVPPKEGLTVSQEKYRDTRLRGRR